MISLFIDTSTSRLVIGVYKDKKQIYFNNEYVGNDLSSRVLPDIQNVLFSLSLKPEQIDEIYVVNGPGSFTGIRVGVTITKTLAWTLNKKIYVVSELQLLATTSTDKKYIVPMIDARRNCVYAGMYNKSLQNILDDQYINYEELIKKIEEKCSLNEVEFVSYDALENVIEPNINVEKLFNIEFKEVNAHNVNPNYLKKTEAEENLNAKRN